MTCFKARRILVLLGTLPTIFSTAHAITIYQHSFGGGVGDIDGLAPDVGANNWVASSQFNADGSIADNAGSGTQGGTATLAFAPLDGSIYTLDASFTGVAGNNNWLAMGFVEGQDTDVAFDNRFVTGPSVGKAWMFHRGDSNLQTNNAFLGSATSGTADGVGFSPAFNGGGDIDLRIVLDTTGGAGSWTSTWFAKLPASGSYSEVRPEATLLDETITAVGIAKSNDGVTGAITSLLLSQDTPPPPNQWNVDGGGSFNTAGNWLDNVVPTDTALFGGVLTEPNAPASVTLDSPASVTGVSFQNASTYTIDGPSTLTLTADASVNTSLGVHEINVQIAGANGLTKTGSGTLTLSNGSNSYTGDTILSGGTLNVTNLGALNQSSGVTNVAAGTLLQFNGDGEGNGASGALSEELTGDGTVRLATGLTTEVITASTANSSFNGDIEIAGGKLSVTNADALGSTDNTSATGTSVGGGADLVQGTLELAGVTVTDEQLELVGRQPGQTVPHFTSSGTSEWSGDVVGIVGGNQFNVESQSDTLTISGDITLADSSERFLNLSGAGDGRIEGLIIDRTLTEGDGAENRSISLVKTGSGTWTIATVPPPEDTDPESLSTARDGYHQRRTVVAEGTLAVQSTGGTAGELFSETIEVASGATFDISSFTNYSLQVTDDPDMVLSTGDETGQTLTGAGQVNVGGTLQAFDDSTIAPGDSIGTLTVNGNFVHSTFADTPAGAWNYELGSSTSSGDRLLVNGSATINAGAASNAIVVNVTPVEGTLAAGAYTLIQANTRGGSATNNAYVETVFDAQGNDITSDMRQTVSVANSGNNVVLNVTGSSANLNWAGTLGNAWDIQSTNNWTGGDTQFSQLDNVTFGNVANKSVSVNASVAPGSVTFNGGGGSTYTVTGTGGMTGFGDVDVNSGTVQLNNTGNAYAGTTTIASGARLEINTASTGDMVVNGTLSVGGAGVATGGAQTFYSDNFDGPGATPLNGTTPDTTFDGESWVAAPTFEADGDSVTGTAGGSATLAFTPIDGSTYVLETSISNIVGDTDWFALGFANGQSAASSSNSRFITATVEGVAWANYRGAQSDVSANQAFLGDPSIEPNSGLASPAAWLVDGTSAGGSVDIRITLDTTGGPGDWTATWEANTGSGFQVIRANESLLSEAINSVGVANSNSADLSGTIESFLLTGTEPANARLNGQTLNVEGDLTMGASSTLEFDIALAGQDFIDVAGAATLNGTIDVTQLGSFTLAGGTQYTLLTAADGIIDLGVNYILPSGFSASIVDFTDLVIAIGLQGDFNGDGIVNLADYTVWRDNLGGNEDDGLLGGNGNGGIVDATDYQLWKDNFGNGSAASLGVSVDESAVPEPATWLTLVIGVVTLFAGRMRLAPDERE